MPKYLELNKSESKSVTPSSSGTPSYGDDYATSLPLNVNFKVVSLFSGCGGMDRGLVGGFTHGHQFYPKLPFDIKWANDFNKDACATYAKNIGNHIVCGDIRQILIDPVKHGLPDSCDVVIGGFPCQPFSTAGLRKGLADPRGMLYLSMKEVVKRLQPKAFIAENVKGLLSIDSGNTIKQIIKDFTKLGYDLRYALYHTADYGIAQTRERIIIVGTKRGELLPFKHLDAVTPGLNRPSVESVLSDLESLNEGEVANHYWSKARKNKGQGNTTLKKDSPGPTIRAEHHGNIEFHYNGLRRLSAREAARIQSFPDDFEFLHSTSAAYKQIGNAVPPVLGWHLANALASHLSHRVVTHVQP